MSEFFAKERDRGRRLFVTLGKPISSFFLNTLPWSSSFRDGGRGGRCCSCCNEERGDVEDEENQDGTLFL